MSRRIWRVDQLHQLTQRFRPVLGSKFDEEGVDDSRDGVADHARRVSDRAEDVGLDVGDDLGGELVEAETDVVLEEKTGHRPDGDILLGHLAEDVGEVRIVVRNLVKRLQALRNIEKRLAERRG